MFIKVHPKYTTLKSINIKIQDIHAYLTDGDDDCIILFLQKLPVAEKPYICINESEEELDALIKMARGH